MKKPIIIGLGGLKRSGKSTIARHIGLVAAQQGLNNVRHSFASPIYDMMYALMANAGMSTDEQKAAVANKEAGIEALSFVSLRELMQTLGTEWGRETLFDNFWVAIASDKIERSHSDVVLFDDVRFTNEVNMIRQWGGKVVRLTRRSVTAGDTHVSETQDYNPDFEVANNDEPMRVAETIWDMINDE